MKVRHGDVGDPVDLVGAHRAADLDFIAERHQVGAGKTVRIPGQLIKIHIIGQRNALEMRLKEKAARRGVGQGHVNHPRKTARAQEGGVYVPGVVGGAQQQGDAVGILLKAIHLAFQFGRYGLLAGAGAAVHLAADAVKLINEQHRGLFRAHLFKQGGDVALGGAHPFLLQVAGAHMVEGSADLVGDGAGNHGLAGAGQAEHQDAAARTDTIPLVQLGLAHGLDHELKHFPLDALQPGNVIKADARVLDGLEHLLIALGRGGVAGRIFLLIAGLVGAGFEGAGLVDQVLHLV